MTDLFFKVTTVDRQPPTARVDYTYPVKRWTRHIDEPLRRCATGWHLIPDRSAALWRVTSKGRLWVAEPCLDHPPVVLDDEAVTCRMRLVREVTLSPSQWRRLAADYAEAALLGERASGREPDARSWAAVEAARAFADGTISRSDLDAARAAAWDAAWFATRSAGDAADAVDVVWDAAWAAGDGDLARAPKWERFKAYAPKWERFKAYALGEPIPPVEPLYGKDMLDADEEDVT